MLDVVSRTLSRLFGGASRRTSSTAGGYVPAAPVLSGTFVTPQTALGLAAVYAAINVISRDLATLPRYVERRLPDGGWCVDTAKPVQDVIAVKPNDDMDAFSYFQTSMSHVLGWGNSYSEIVRDGRGDATELLLLHPAKTKVKRTEAGSLYYELDNKKVLPPESVLHFKGMGFDGVQGYSPLTVARQTIGLAMGAEQFGAAFFGNGAVAKGILKLAKRLSTNAQNNLRSSINQVHQGSQAAHQFLILEEGMDWINNQITPDDGQWLGTREFQVKEISRIYSLPPHKIGDYSESHLANVEEANSDYITTTLAGWVCMLEAQMNLKLLTRQGRLQWRIRIDMDGLLRGNIESRMKKIQTMRNTGAWSADDIRLSENENPLGPGRGGDLYIVQGQYVPLDQIGKSPLPPPAPQLRLVREGQGQGQGLTERAAHE